MASFKLTQLYEAQDGICPRCVRRMNPLKKIPRADHGLDATIDHVMSRALGGSDSLANMLAMCSRCNNAKGDKPPNGCDLIWLTAINARFDFRSPPWDMPTLKILPVPRSTWPTLAAVWPEPRLSR